MEGMVKNNSRIALLSFVLSSIILLSVGVSLGGNGRLDSTTGRFDFIISFRFYVSDDEIRDLVKPRFREASQILYDATDQQHQFGRIIICRNMSTRRYADFLIDVRCTGDCGRSQVTQPGNFGIADHHALIKWPRILDPVSGHYTLAHEFSHLAYNLRDEYEGQDAPSTHCTPLTSGTTTCLPPVPGRTACLMGDYNPGEEIASRTPTLNEFCVTCNHNNSTDPSVQSYQEAIHHEACWVTLSESGSRFPLIAPPPSALPNPNDGADRLLGYSGPTFTIAVPETRIVLIIDRSGSMAPDFSDTGEDRIGAAKDGAIEFIAALPEADELENVFKLGVVSFADMARPDQSLQPVSETIKTNAVSAINGLVAEGATAMGLGLQEALALLATEPDTACPEIFILLSDGAHNTDTHPLDLLEALKSRGAIVYTIGIGSEVEEEVLQTLAEQTGGQYFTTLDDESPIIERAALAFVAAEPPQILEDSKTSRLKFKLQNIFTELLAITQEAGFLANELGKINIDEIKTIPVQIDSQTSRATFILNWDDAAFDLGLTLRTPSDRLITPENVLGDSSITIKSDSTFKIFIIKDPEVGIWETRIAGAIGKNLNFEFVGLSNAKNTGLVAITNKEEFIFPDPILVTAQPFTFDTPVAGADVSGIVTRPDGSETSLRLYDDRTHGDEKANDGIYSNFFIDFEGENGAFTFNITAKNINGSLVQGEAIEPGGPDTRVPNTFTRKNRFKIKVTGVPPEQNLFGIDSNDSKLVKVDINVANRSILELGTIKDRAIGARVKEIEAMTWDPQLGRILLISNIPNGALYKIDQNKIPMSQSTDDIPAELVGYLSSNEIEGIAIHPDNHKLYGVDTNKKDKLITINKTTGKESTLGMLKNFGDVEGLAFRLTPNPVLYGIDSDTNKLITIDIVTGIATPVNSLNQIGIPDIECLEFAPDGTLFGFSNETRKFIKIDPISGIGTEFTVEGSQKFDLEGLAFMWPEALPLTTSALALTKVAVRRLSSLTTTPIDFVLEQNNPNPFSDETSIRFQLSAPAHVALRILSDHEKEICILLDQNLNTGVHTVRWDGKDSNGNAVPNGNYLYRLQVGTDSQIKQMILHR